MLKKLCILLLLIFCIHTNAQVTYVDVNPDSCVCVGGWASDSSAWDLDNNGVADFKIYVSSNSSSGGNNSATIGALLNNGVVDNGYGALQLNAGDTINSHTNWVSGNNLIEYCGFIGYSGNWQGANDNYLGIRFYAGATLYYGWIHVYVVVGTAEAVVAIKEYAYSTSLITAGEGTPTGIQEIISSNKLSIYPNPNNGSFVIEPKAATKQTVMVYDVTGKMVLSQTINGKTSIDASSLNEGVYNISIISSKGVINKRFVIVK